MFSKYLLFFFTVLIALSSCTKEEDDPIQASSNNTPSNTQAIDTITPGSYFPAYPGSNWQYVVYKNYVNNYEYTVNTDTSYQTDRTSPNYKPHSYETLLGTDSTGTRYIYGYTDTVMVPFYEGEAIYRYHKIDLAPQGTHDTKYPFLSEKLGEKFQPKYSDPRWPYNGPYMEVIDKTIDANNDSIIVVKGDYLGNYRNYTLDFYTYKKDVGLVSHIITSENHSDTLYRKILVNYSINN